MKMRVPRYSPLYILILIIADNCLTITDCADSGRESDKNVHETSSTPRARKLRNVKRATSTSGTAGRASTLNAVKYNWSRAVDDDILAFYYDSLRNGSVDWKRAYAILCVRHPNIPDAESTHNRVHTILQRIYQTTPARGEGNFLWTRGMKFEVLKIYYETRGGEETEHAERMYNKWRNEYPNFPNISPIDLLHQAENMLMRNDLLHMPVGLPKERLLKINADRYFVFNPRHEDFLRKVYENLDPKNPVQTDELYEEVCKVDPTFRQVSPQRILLKMRNLKKELKRQHQRLDVLEEPREESDALNQGHHHHEFTDILDRSPLQQQSAHNHAHGVGTSRSHRESSHHHPDLDMYSDSFIVGTPRTRHPSVNLENRNPRTRETNADLDLSLLPLQKKGKSILKE